MCSSLFLYNKYYLLLLLIIISLTCGEQIVNSSNIDLTTKTTTLPVIVTTIVNDDREELTTTIRQTMDKEPQLPIDLLSDDVLLDPNVVLARLSRRDIDNTNQHRQEEYFNKYNNWYLSQDGINKRKEYNSRRKFDEERQRDIPKKIKIYPVFPGK